MERLKKQLRFRAVFFIDCVAGKPASLWFCDTWTDGDGSMLLLSGDGSFAPVRP